MTIIEKPKSSPTNTTTFFVLALVALMTYTVEFSTGLIGNVSEGLGNSLQGILMALQPYRFLVVISAVYILFRSDRHWKRVGLALLFGASLLGALSSPAEGVEAAGMAAYLPLFLCLLGLMSMLAMPHIDLWRKVVVGLFVGILLGFDLAAFDVAYYSMYLKIFGTLFIDLIMMIVIPLIFFSLISGINSISDTSALGRVGLKALGSYIFTSIFAISVGIWLGNVFEPGVGFDLSGLSGGGSGVAGHEMPKLLKTLLNIIPDNAIGAMAGTEMWGPKVSGDASAASAAVAADMKSGALSLGPKPHTLQAVFVAIFIGVALVVMGKEGKQVADLCHGAAQLMFKIISFIIRLAPLAVFGLMAWVSSTLGVDALIQLGNMVLATITGMGIHYIFIIFCLIFILRLNPIPFMLKSVEYQMIAFSTTSSKATLATSMEVCEKKIGVSKPITSFILPLGAAVNMDGTAIYLGISALFFAQAYGVPLEFYHYALIVFTSTIAAVGAAGYPGGSLVVMSLVLTTIGVPVEGIAVLIGVDRILDMFRTTINITSDVAITAFIDKTEGNFDKKTYYKPAHEIDVKEEKEFEKELYVAAHPEVRKPKKKKSAAKKKPASRKKK